MGLMVKSGEGSDDSTGELNTGFREVRTKFTPYPSNPLVTINIPEPMITKAEFVYNCYEKDERVNDSGVQVVIDLGDKTRNKFRVDHIPRYNTIHFGPMTDSRETGEDKATAWLFEPEVWYEDFLHKFGLLDVSWSPTSQESFEIWNQYETIASSPGFTGFSDPSKRAVFFFMQHLKNMISQGHAIREDAIPNGHFSSGYIRDNEIDSKFYNSLSRVGKYFGNTDSEGMTPAGFADMMMLRTNITGSYFSNGVAIRDALTNMQPMGVHYASKDNTENQVIDAVRSVRLVDFGQNYNNLVNLDLFKAAIEDPLTAYYEEFFKLIPQAARVQRDQRAMPPYINPFDWDLNFHPLFEIDGNSVKFEPGLGDYYYDRFEDNFKHRNELSCPIGFLIEKFCLNADGTVQRFPPMYRWGYTPKNLVDAKIRYGVTYIYQISTISISIFESFEARVESVRSPPLRTYAWALTLSKGRYVYLPAVESIPPPAPLLIVTFDYDRDCTALYWQPPLEPQRDIVKFQVFRRRTVNQPFTLIGQIDFDHSHDKFKTQENIPPDLNFKYPGPEYFFHDTGFVKERDYIYAVVAIDAHGLNSCYSNQIECQFDIYRNRLKTRQASQAGAPKPYPNLYLSQDLFVDTMKDSGSSRMRIFFNPEYSSLSDQRVVEAGTGERSIAGVNPGSSVVQNIDMHLLADKYRIQIINTDDQQAQIVDIGIEDQTGYVANVTDLDPPVYAEYIAGGHTESVD